jgi:hypothetical protein
MWTRRQFLTRSTLSMLGVTGTALAFQGDGARAVREMMPDGSQARGMMTDKCESAVERGLKYLSQWQGQDGSWGSGGYAANVAVTSLSALAMMANGSMPGRGHYGEHVRRALTFVLDRGDEVGRRGPFGAEHPPGFLHNSGQVGQQGPMYSHGFGTLFLGEVCGMLADATLAQRVRTALSKAVEIILKAQNHEGGWRYNPRAFDADISVTVCQMMALRSAKNAGIDVPIGNRERCIKYVKNCQLGDGSFVYQAGNPKFVFPGNSGGFARTAAGVAALYSAGIYTGQEIDRGLSYLVNSRPRRAGGFQQADMHYFYGHYYAVQAMWTAGGDYWSRWFPEIRNELIECQHNDGSWSDMICPQYATAMACIILQVPNNYLPILQK